MAWLESHQTLRDHPKVLRLARLLDVQRTSVVGLLHFLWWWALDHAEDGDVTDFDALDLAVAAGWEGDPDEFVKALMECGPGDRSGFLHREGDRLVLHDWWDYAGKLVDRRIKDRERKKVQRQKSDSGPKDVQRTSDGTPAVQNTTQPDTTEPNPKPSSRKRSDQATRLPDDWRPTPEPELVAAIGGQAAAKREFAKFGDYWRAKAGKDGRKVDWQATWRNWLRTAADNKPGRRGGPAPPAPEDADWTDGWEGRIA